MLDTVGRLRLGAALTDIRMAVGPGAPEERPVMEGIDAAHAIRSAYTVRASAPRDLTPRELDVLNAAQRCGCPRHCPGRDGLRHGA